METRRICPRCALELTPDQPEEECPRCELMLAMAPLPRDLSEETDWLGLEMGGYELLSRIDKGGMGIVYQARQRHPERTVALKLARSDRIQGEVARQRFLNEAKTAAQLKHPNIIPIFEVGECEGVPFFSMLLVDGSSLGKRLKARRENESSPPSPADLKDSARLMVKVARAVQYAHQKGVLHRDLKPANILLDAKMEPYLTDFGLAKRIEEDLGLTVTGEVMGTPCYMPPEQAEGQNSEVTVFSDVYSLGAILYELLTGRPPHVGKTNPEILHKVSNDPVVRPRLRNRKVPRDLDTICMKCLAPHPNKRYESAEALARDLERWIRNEPITARPVPRWERSWKWVCRQPHKAGLIGVAVLSLVAISFFGFWVKHLIDRHYQQQGFNEAAAHFEAGKPASAVSILSQLVEDHPEFDLASTRLMYALTQHPFPLATLPHTTNVTELAYTPDGRHLATADMDGVVRLWETLRGGLEATLVSATTAARDKGPSDPALCLDFSPDGSRLLVGFESGRIELWHREQPAPIHEDTIQGLVRKVAIHESGEPLVVVSVRGIKVIDLASGTSRISPAGTNRIFCAALGAGGSRLATGNLDDGGIVLWNIKDLSVTAAWQGHSNTIRSLQFSADNQRLLSSSEDGTVRTWNIPSGEPAGPMLRHSSPALSAGFNRLGTHVVTRDQDQRVRVWEVETGMLAIDPLPHPRHQQVSAAMFHPRGRFVVTACNDGRIRFWEAQTGLLFGMPAVHELGPPYNDFPYIDHVRFATPGAQMATAGAGHAVRLWGFPGGQLPFQAFRTGGESSSYLVAPGDLYAWSMHGETLDSWPLIPSGSVRQRFEAGPFRTLFPCPTRPVVLGVGGDGKGWLVGEGFAQPIPIPVEGSIQAAGWSSNGRTFWIRTDREVRVHNLNNPVPPVLRRPMDANVTWLGLSPDAACLAWTAGSTVTIRSLESENRPSREVTVNGPIEQARFSDDGSTLLVLSASKAMLLDVARGRLTSLFQHPERIQAADLSADGSMVATLTGSTELRIWRVGQERRPASLQELEFRANSLSLSRGGRWVAFASPERFLKILDTASGISISDRIDTRTLVWDVRFALDDRWMVANTQQGPLLWELPPHFERPPPWLAKMGRGAASLLLATGGEMDRQEATIRQILSMALAGSSPVNDTVRWASWVYADPRERTFSPSSRVRLMDHLFEGSPTGNRASLTR